MSLVESTTSRRSPCWPGCGSAPTSWRRSPASSTRSSTSSRSSRSSTRPDVEPLAHGIEVRNVFRDDVRGPSLPREEALANAPKRNARELPGPRRPGMTGPRPRRARPQPTGHPGSGRSPIDVTRATATGLLAQLNAGAITSEEVVRAYLDRAERLGRLNVFVHLDPEAVAGPGPRRSTRSARPASRSARWPACRSRSRTCSASRASRRPAAAGCSRTSGRPTTPP